MLVITCPHCLGTRNEPAAATAVSRQCTTCDGRGWIWYWSYPFVVRG